MTVNGIRTDKSAGRTTPDPDYHRIPACAFPTPPVTPVPLARSVALRTGRTSFRRRACRRP